MNTKQTKSRIAKRVLENNNGDEDISESKIEISKKYSLKHHEVSQFLKKDFPTNLITTKSKNILQRFQLNSELTYRLGELGK